MRALLIFTLCLFCKPPLRAGDWSNPVDSWAREKLEWQNRDLADGISDVGLGIMIAGPLIYTGLTAENKWQSLGGVGLAYLVNKGITKGVKLISGRTRPNGEDNESFFSGHSSTSAVGAAVLCTQSHQWCPVGIAVAGMVGYLRVASAKHNASDVVIGWAVGAVNGTFVPQIVMRF